MITKKLSFFIGAGLPLTARATTRQSALHTQAQLNDVGRQCGLALGEMVQDRETERLFFFMRDESTLPGRLCVFEFAEKNNLKVVKLDGITFAEE